MGFRSKGKLFEFFLITFFVLLLGEHCYAEIEPVFYTYKETAITDDADISIIGLFPLTSVTVKTDSQGFALRIENNSSHAFKLKKFDVRKMFDGDYQEIIYCPKVIASGAACDCFFAGTLRSLESITNATDVSISYSYEDDKLQEKQLRPWPAVLASQDTFDFSMPYTLTLKNVFPDKVVIQKMWLKDGIEEVEQISNLGACYNIESGASCTVEIPAQKNLNRHRTLIVEYNINGHIEMSYIGLKNAAYNVVRSGLVDHVYQYMWYYAVPVGVAVITGTISGILWYLKSGGNQAVNNPGMNLVVGGLAAAAFEPPAAYDQGSLEVLEYIPQRLTAIEKMLATLTKTEEETAIEGAVDTVGTELAPQPSAVIGSDTAPPPPPLPPPLPERGSVLERQMAEILKEVRQMKIFVLQRTPTAARSVASQVGKQDPPSTPLFSRVTKQQHNSAEPVNGGMDGVIGEMRGSTTDITPLGGFNFQSRLKKTKLLDKDKDKDKGKDKGEEPK